MAPAYAALVYLKQDLEFILTSFHNCTFRNVQKCRQDYIFGYLDRTRDMAAMVKKSLDMLFHKDEFLEKLYNTVVWMESVLKNSSGIPSQIRDAAVSIMTDIVEEKKKREPLFWNQKLRDLYHNTSLLYSLLTDPMEGDCILSRIREAVVTVKTEIEKTRYCNEDILKLKDKLDSLLGDRLFSGDVFFIHDFFRKAERPLLYRYFQKLCDNIKLMESMLRDSSGGRYHRQMMIEFQSQIRNVVHNAANLLQFQGEKEIIVNLTRPCKMIKRIRPTIHNSSSFDLTLLTELPKVIQATACFNEELIDFHKNREVIGITEARNLENTSSITGDSAPLNPTQETHHKGAKLVGLKKELEQMLHGLTGQSSAFQIFTIVGMAGIGKTTFAKELYNHPLVMHHFYVRAWITVSQDYELRPLLLGLLSCVTNLSDELYESGNEQLREKLYRSLMGKRYLIVLDDVWDKQVWDDVKRVFPNDMIGSRIVLTSRLHDVALYSSSEVPHCLRCLNQEESWELLCSKMFANRSCPLELLPIGMEIARKCYGLPLAIVLVGGLLSKMNKTLTVWEEVAKNVAALVIDDSQRCQDILALSYDHLPDPLKECFLYMGVFPEDYEISSRKLISLWIAEGFVQPNNQKTLEEVAEDYLEDLVVKCLVLVKRRRSNGRIKTCGIHDLMRDFCVRESEKEMFLHVIHGSGVRFKRNKQGIKKYLNEFQKKPLRRMLRVAIHSNLSSFTEVGNSLELTRSFFCFESKRSTELKSCSGILFNFLNILDMMHVNLPYLPNGILSLIYLKYLALTILDSLSVLKICRLDNLQTCIINGEYSGYLPEDFWNMTELRNLCVKRRRAPSCQEYKLNALKFPVVAVLQNLQSLSTVGPSSCTREILISMPNLKKLGVYETEEDYPFVGWYKNLAYLIQLETLKYAFSNPFSSSRVPRRLPSWHVFLLNLKKLTLSGTRYPWEDMHQLSLLPKLEILKLKNYAFAGAVWELGESRFSYLKYLMIGSTNLEVWVADVSHFPSLEYLGLRHCRSLKEVPYGLIEVPLLEKIELHCCGDSAVISARRMQQEQQESGDDWLKVYITQR